MTPIRVLLDFLADEDFDSIRRLCERRDVGGRGKAAQCESLARSYRGDHAQFLEDILKQDLVRLLASPTEIGGEEYYLPSAGRYAKDKLEAMALALFRDEKVPHGFVSEEDEDEDEDENNYRGAKTRNLGQVSKDVFVVHGHDEMAKLKVQNFLHKLGLTPIVLHEQLNQGRTIIEKLERESKRAQFAIVLLTPDDKGCTASDTDLRSRARQNVIFEWGLFVGLLGRGNVCALRVGSVEMPSDMHGVIWESMDGPWESQVAKEMRAAGLNVDLNKL